MAGTLGKKLPKRSTLGHPSYVGKRYGGRVVLSIGTVVKGYQMWNCRCDCGFESAVSAISMDKGEQHRCKDCQRRDQIAHRSRCWRGGVSIPMTEFNRWQRSAVKRSLEWGMTFEYLDALIEEQDWRCALTGVRLAFNHGYCNAGEGNASLDRIESDRGYVEGNVQFVTKSVNFGKQAMTDGDFIEMCRQVVEHAREKRGQLIAPMNVGPPVSTAA